MYSATQRVNNLFVIGRESIQFISMFIQHLIKNGQGDWFILSQNTSQYGYKCSGRYGLQRQCNWHRVQGQSWIPSLSVRVKFLIIWIGLEYHPIPLHCCYFNCISCISVSIMYPLLERERYFKNTLLEIKCFVHYSLYIFAQYCHMYQFS